MAGSSRWTTIVPMPDQVVMRVEAVFAGAVETFQLPDGERLTSAIRKVRQSRKVPVGELGLMGDECHDPAHGGPNRALHAFPVEHYAVFSELAGRAIEAPSFGENLSLRGLPDGDACVGDVLRVGGAVLQITMPTERCKNPGRLAGVPMLLKWVVDTSRSGYYLRVRETGEIGPDDACELLSRPHPEWSIATLTASMYRRIQDRRHIETLQAIPELAPEWKRRLWTLHRRAGGGSV